MTINYMREIVKMKMNQQTKLRFALEHIAHLEDLFEDNIAKELGSKVDYMTCSDPHSTWDKIVIEYNHELKEKETSA